MEIKLLIGGKEYSAVVSESDVQKITAETSRFQRKSIGEKYFALDSFGAIWSPIEKGENGKKDRFSFGNYFTTEKQAQDHLRALKLWQAIKVFRQEREGDDWKKLRWGDEIQPKYVLCFAYDAGTIQVASVGCWKGEGTFFAHKETAAAAADEFYGELVWYFTEFEDD